MQSSPGFPWAMRHVTNASLYKDCVDSQTVLLLVKERLEELKTKPLFGLVRLFIKREPHKLNKIEEKRYRLISSVGIVDQIIGQILFRPLDEFELDNYHQLPVKVGMTTTNGDLFKVMSWLGKGPYVDIDKSAWDWTLPDWLFDMHAEVRAKLFEKFGQFELATIVRNYYKALMQPYFCLSSGEVFRLPFPIQLSGGVSTLSDNSRSSLFLRLVYERMCGRAIDYHLVIALGDDTNEVIPPNLDHYLNWLRDQGLATKVSKPTCSLFDLEFCSRHLVWMGSGHGHIFTSYKKQIWNFIKVAMRHADASIRAQSAESLLSNLCCDEVNFSRVSKLIEYYVGRGEILGFQIPTREQLVELATGCGDKNLLDSHATEKKASEEASPEEGPPECAV